MTAETEAPIALGGPPVPAAVALAAVIGVAVASVVDAPSFIRLPLVLAVVGFAPGAAVLSHLRMPKSAATLSVQLGLSVSITILFVQVLMWFNQLTVTTAVAGMLVFLSPSLVSGMRACKAVPDE